jgi:hypothetical protein
MFDICHRLHDICNPEMYIWIICRRTVRNWICHGYVHIFIQSNVTMEIISDTITCIIVARILELPIVYVVSLEGSDKAI